MSNGTKPGTGISTGSQGSVGQGNYVVKQGDCIESIAFNYGLFWGTVWDDPKNLQLRTVRKSPNVLLPGDKVFVPEKRLKEESGATEQTHRFKRKGVPSKLQIKLLDEDGKPRGNLNYCIIIEGKLRQDKTSMDGWIRVPIVPNAQRGRLIVQESNKQEVYELNLGNIDPIDQLEGVRQRLKNLGFDCGGEEGELGEQTKAALKEFQRQYQLPESGEPDQATQAKLKQVYGC